MTVLLNGTQQIMVLQVLAQAARPLTVAQIRDSRPDDFVLGSILAVIYTLKEEGYLSKVAGIIDTYELTDKGRARAAAAS